MSPLFVTAESRERPAPGDPAANRVVADRLLRLAGRVEDFLDGATETLCFEEYDALRETETKLRAFANLLVTRDTDHFLRDELSVASEVLEHLRDRLG
ncbi:hypothetical protein Mal64_35510 [Pseudobythopirellula maris]|uniref:Uncharacterized protein n=1 Tax=Pseudobythopirellula maris TaxID=2527991 RepID=A0A5C5ZH95_9BACT|nr:hypothetical protein [Pseudobythopirellula maris]TWT86722.1 hypothetical protein Mal64_35510 [Pseudobythopirellula maris]